MRLVHIFAGVYCTEADELEWSR